MTPQPQRVQAERLHAHAASGGSIVHSTDIAEALHARGRFDWEMKFPVPHHLDGFIACRDEIDGIELLPIRDRAPLLSLLHKRKRQLAEFKQDVQWRDSNHNLVVTVGGNDVLNQYLAGSSYTAAFFLGLISLTSYTTGVVLADTMASHAGWAEDVTYSNSTRIAMVWAAASAKSKALTTPLVYNVNGSTTFKGSFMTTVSTKSGSTGILVTGGLFTGSDQPAVNGNTLSASYSLGV